MYIHAYINNFENNVSLTLEFFSVNMTPHKV